MSKVARNIIYNGVGQGISVVLGFVAVRLVFRRLGGDALGLIYFSVALSSALSVAVRLGICESAVREVAAHNESRPDYIRRFVRTCSTLYWLGYALLGTVAFVAAPYFIHHWVKLVSLDAATATRMMRILTLGALVTLPLSLYRALLMGLQHMGATNLIDVGSKAVQQGGIFLILLAHGSLFQVAWWIAVSTAMPILAYLAVGARFFSVRAMLLPGFSTDVVKQNFRFASGLVAITLCSWLLTEIDKITVSKLLPLALLGLYTFTRSAVSQGQMVTSAISNAVFPHLSALHGSHDRAGLRRTYDVYQDLICLGTAPVFAGIVFAAVPVFSRVFDAHSAHLLLVPTTFLCIGSFMNGALNTPYVVSLAVGRPDIAARQNALALLVVVPVSACAIYWFGLNGAGLSWVIYHIYAYSYGLPQICQQCIGIAPRAWYQHFLRILGTAVVIYGLVWQVLRWTGSSSVAALATGYIAGSIVYGAAGVWLMGDSLRATALGYLGRGRIREVAVAR